MLEGVAGLSRLVRECLLLVTLDVREQTTRLGLCKYPRWSRHAQPGWVLRAL